MARQRRIQAEGLSYHVTARGTGRMSIFLDAVDRRRFLALLGVVVAHHELDCHAYCLMTNHYHLVVTTTRANLSRAMQQLNGRYAERWNRRHERVGHLFQGRYGAQLVQDGAYFLTVCRYVALNPVRAGLVTAPERWPWSSFPRDRGSRRPAAVSSTRGAAVAVRRLTGRSLRPATATTCAADAGDEGPLPANRILGDDVFAQEVARDAGHDGRECRPRSGSSATR